MAYPPDAPSDVEVSRYVGTVMAELAATLVFYIALKIIHFLVWGHFYLQKNQNIEGRNQADVDERQWDQNQWDVCFPIIFANHVIALSMPLLYMPSVLVCVLAFVHFGLFVGLIIVNVFIRDLERGKGARTTASRIMWGLMCLINITLLILGLVRMKAVITNT